MSREAIVSFSQRNENVKIYHLIKDVLPQKVFWVDVGANDPVHYSVTLLFSMRGGRGVNIEPQSTYKNRYEEYRPRDINLCVGVGEEHGSMTISGRGCTGSLEVDGKGEKTEVYTLSEIFRDYVPEGQEVHFLKIDVEGFEKKCLKGMDFQKWRPWVLCIESNDTEKWEPILLNAGYEFVFTDDLNRYYIEENHRENVERAKCLPDINKIYDILTGNDPTKWMEYEDSTSWKVTAPLRAISEAFKRIRNRKS